MIGEAKVCPKCKVDIVPIQSPVVCGLHVQDNLRVIPASENRMKLNSLRRELLSA